MSVSCYRESRRSQAEALEWCDATVSWPVERVITELEVAAVREINPLEWVTLFMLETFAVNPPTLEEASNQLGIGDAKVLRAMLEHVIGQGAVESTDPQQGLELARCRLTPKGRQFLTEGRMGAVSERHGLTVHLDSLTDEVIESSRRFVDQPTHEAVMPIEQLPTARTNIGLDRLRDLAVRLTLPFATGDSQIVGSQVLANQGKRVWRSQTLKLTLKRSGDLEFTLPTGTEAQKAWLANQALPFLQRLIPPTRPGWANVGWSPVGASLDDWLKAVDQLVSPSTLAETIIELVDAASGELILHEGWCGSADIKMAIERAAQRGVRCHVRGQPNSISHWSPRHDGPPGFVAGVADPETTIPLALIADELSGMQVSRICVRCGGQDVELEIAARLRPRAAQQLRHEMAGGPIPAADDVQACFAAFALHRQTPLWNRGVDLLRASSSGLDAVAKLREWANWGAAILPDHGPAGGWSAPAVQAWNTALSDDAPIAPLLHAAKDLIPPAEAIGKLAGRIEDSRIVEDERPFCDLLAVADLASRFWPDVNPFAACPKLIERVRNGLDITPERLTEESVGAIQTFADTALFKEDARRLARWVYACLPAPADAAELLLWLQAVIPLRPSLEQRIEPAIERMIRQIRQTGLVPAASVEPASLERAGRSLGLPARLLNQLRELSPPAGKTRRNGGVRSYTRSQK